MRVAAGGERLAVLLLCDFDLGSAGTTIDHCQAFQRHSRHAYYFFNPRGTGVPVWLDLDAFDVIVVHYSIYILGDNYLGPGWRQRLRDSPAFKVAFIQDEYRHILEFHDRLKELRVGLLCTCWPMDQVEQIYPSSELPGLRKHTVLTGYVPDHLERATFPDPATRPIDVGYRGRDVRIWWLGELYYEKVRIANEFAQRARGTPLRCDISHREEDRLYGEAWLGFLRTCRTTLGTESGASVVDFTGEVEHRTRAYMARRPNAPFEEVQRACFLAEEGRYRMNQVSPRLFEAIGCGSVLVLFEGEYSGVVQPDVHYIPLRKDFGNFDEVVAKVRDDELCRRLARRAYDDVIASGRWSYRRSVADVDDLLDELVPASRATIHRARRREGELHKLLERSSRLLGAANQSLFLASLSRQFVNDAISTTLTFASRLVRGIGLLAQGRTDAPRRHPFLLQEQVRLLAAHAARALPSAHDDER